MTIGIFTHEVAQICENGHLINDHAGSRQAYNQNACCKCGKPTHTCCPDCRTYIPGCKHEVRQISSSTNPNDRQAKTYSVVTCQKEPYVVPLYCLNCGKPYPWTEATLNEIAEIIDMAEEGELDEVDKAILKEKFPQILIDSTGSISAALRISKILKPVATTTGKALSSALYSKIAGHLFDLIFK